MLGKHHAACGSCLADMGSAQYTDSYGDGYGQCDACLRYWTVTIVPAAELVTHFRRLTDAERDYPVLRDWYRDRVARIRRQARAR